MSIDSESKFACLVRITLAEKKNYGIVSGGLIYVESEDENGELGWNCLWFW